MAPARQAAVFAGAVAVLWLLFVVQAWNTPVVLDDWYQLVWHRNHPFGLSSIWQYAHFNYFYFNPRIGDVLLMLVNGPRAIHLIATPVVEVGLLWVGFAVGFGRWPRPTLRDLQLLLFIQAMIWIVIPIPGMLYFYRPFCTNYLWAFATTLGLFAGYRTALAAPAPLPARTWSVPLMFALGWLSGMSNEHTGPTQMVALLIFVIAAWKLHRLRAWMVAGLAGLYVGYPMLFFAPGQALRYAGNATHNTPLNLLKDRGPVGCFDIIVDFLGESQIGIDLLLIVVLVYLIAYWRRGERAPVLGRRAILALCGLVLAAGAIVVTQFASPTVGERLFFAPAVLLVLAAAVIVEPMLDTPAVRRFVVAAGAVIFAYHAVRFVGIYWFVKRASDERIAHLQRAAPGSDVKLVPYKAWRRTRWFWGDDFQYASLREYVANELFDLHGIDYDQVLHWSEPAPSDHYVATATFDPPLPPAEVAKIAPTRYVPSFWEWTVVQLRRQIVLRGFAAHDGHRLVHYIIDSEGLGFTDPKHRPLRVIDWTPEKLQFVDGRPYDDAAGRTFVRVWRESVPPAMTEAYVVGGGETHRVLPWLDLEDNLGTLFPIVPTRRGTYTVVLCDPELCWSAGRRFRP